MDSPRAQHFTADMRSTPAASPLHDRLYLHAILAGEIAESLSAKVSAEDCLDGGVRKADFSDDAVFGYQETGELWDWCPYLGHGQLLQTVRSTQPVR